MMRLAIAAALVLGTAGPGFAQDVTPVLEQPVSCLILPWDTIEVASPTTGVVVEVLVERGQPVEAGDLLVRLDDATQRAYLETMKARAADDSQLRQAEVRREIAASAVERNRPLMEKKLLRGDEWDQIVGASRLADIEVDAARAARNLAGLEVVRAEAAIAQTRIAAPARAVVIDVLVSAGEAAGNTPLANLAVIDPLKIELFVSAQNYSAWQPGEAISIEGANAPGTVLDARVKAVDPVADAGTGILRVQLELPNPDLAILAGQQCRLSGLPG